MLSPKNFEAAFTQILQRQNFYWMFRKKLEIRPCFTIAIEFALSSLGLSLIDGFLVVVLRDILPVLRLFL